MRILGTRTSLHEALSAVQYNAKLIKAKAILKDFRPQLKELSFKTLFNFSFRKYNRKRSSYRFSTDWIWPDEVVFMSN